MNPDDIDVLIVGAGLSGIDAACHLRRHCPDRRFVVLEARHGLGGTWSLFRYPGIRSDSDMYTLGYGFKPWTGEQAIADGPSILEYLKDTAREYDLERHIRYRHRVVAASWSTADARWTVRVQRTLSDGSQDEITLRAGFLMMCGGYYRYDQPYTPEFAGRERFTGRIVHPQHWPDDLDVVGRRVVVIGSGATAVTLVPELARDAAQVTMLQRTPTYMITRPGRDALARRLFDRFGPRIGHALTRWKNLLMGMLVFGLARRRPEAFKQRLVGWVRQQLPSGYDVGRHFTPPYRPWDQRLCLVPDGDFFQAIRAGRVDVVTDRIESFTERGIRLASGQELPADLIVTATGLQLNTLADLTLEVDGHTLKPADLLNYKGLMFAGVPNFVATFGYTNASWTLKADLVSRWVCRVLEHQRKTGTRQCVAHCHEPQMPRRPWVDFTSGYFERAIDLLPRQGDHGPWKLNQNYLSDLVALRWGPLEDGILRFSR